MKIKFFITTLLLLLFSFLFFSSCQKRKSYESLSALSTIPLIIFREKTSPNQKRTLIKRIPSSLQKNIVNILKRNGFKAAVISMDSYQQAFSENLSTEKRISIIKNASNSIGNSIGESSSSNFLLIEIKADYYNFISNNFKWTIHAKLSFYNRAKDKSKAHTISGAAFLNHKHYNDYEALEQANPDFLYGIAMFVSTKVKPTLHTPKQKLTIRRSSKKNTEQEENDLLSSDLDKDTKADNHENAELNSKPKKTKLKIKRKIN